MTKQRNNNPAPAHLADGLREENARELTEQELLNVSGGFTHCVAGAHYKEVVLAVRKSAG